MATPPASLISPQWLQEHMNDPSVHVLDASWYMPIHKRDARAEFLKNRIPGSHFFEIDTICAADTTLPHMLPSEREFGVAMDVFGISNGSTVVLYDRLGTFSAARAWYTFRAMGHRNVAVMEGGFGAWTRAAAPLDAMELSAEEAFGKVSDRL